MSLPQSIEFNGMEIALCHYNNLASLNRPALKNRALDLQAKIGADRLPALRTAGGADLMIAWILDVQCGIARASGLEVTPAHFGAPGQQEEGNGGFGGQQQGKRGPAPTQQGGAPFANDYAAEPLREGNRAAPSAHANAMAHRDASEAAAAARRRNQGTFSFA